MAEKRKPVVWNGHHFTVPPFTEAGQDEAGMLLRHLQEGLPLGPPQAKPLPAVGQKCGELRVRDAGHNWRIVYHIDDEAIVILDVFAKTSPQSQTQSIERCQTRLAEYKAIKAAAKKK
jgi:phage-related protein